jgi:hypothetical protein
VWPWEHLAVGYIAVSLAVRIGGRRVDDEMVLAILLGSQLPDLIDKPLAWTLAVLPSGTTLAHSVFVAVPLSALVIGLGRRRGYGHVGLAFALAYLLHLPGDALYGTMTVGSPPSVDAILWPLVPKSAGSDPAGLFSETLYYVGRYRAFLGQPEAVRYLLLESVLLLTALALWLRDRRPGSGLLGRWTARLLPGR